MDSEGIPYRFPCWSDICPLMGFNFLRKNWFKSHINEHIQGSDCFEEDRSFNQRAYSSVLNEVAEGSAGELLQMALGLDGLDLFKIVLVVAIRHSKYTRTPLHMAKGHR